MTPNIRPTNKSHAECWRLDFDSWRGCVEDVRRCIHGKVQVRTEVAPNARVAGPGTDWWRDLSKFWNPRDYKKAVRALDQ